MSATWVPYDDGRNYPLPAERRLVLVRVAVDHPDVSRDLIAVGYLRFAAGDVTCPYFVVPSAVCMLRIVAWCDCLPDEMQFGGAASPWLPQQPPQPLDRVQEPADEGGHVDQRDNAQRGED